MNSSRPPAIVRAVDAAARDVPPAAPSQVRAIGGPGLRKCGDDLVSAKLHEWMQDRGIANGEIAEVLRVSESLVRKLRLHGPDRLRRGGLPVHLQDLMRLPRRYRRQLFDLLEDAFDRTGTHGE